MVRSFSFGRSSARGFPRLCSRRRILLFLALTINGGCWQWRRHGRVLAVFVGVPMKRGNNPCNISSMRHVSASARNRASGVAPLYRIILGRRPFKWRRGNTQVMPIRDEA